MTWNEDWNTRQKERVLAHGLVREAPRVVLRHADINCCIFATRVGAEVADRLGLNPHITPVAAAVVETAATEEFLRTDNLDALAKRHHAGGETLWGVMLGRGKDGPGIWGGHLAFFLGHWLVDLSIDQACKPYARIGDSVMPFCRALSSEEWERFIHGKDIRFKLGEHGAAYWATDNVGFTTSGDWMMEPPEHLIEEIKHAITDEWETPTEVIGS